MALRTTSEEVQAVIDVNTEDPSIDINLNKAMVTANRIVDYIVTKDTDSLLNDDLLVEIETYLAAHFYALRDPQYQQKTTGKASAVFQGQTGKRFELTWWGQQALSLDISGTLENMNQGNVRPVFAWLGKPVSEQIEYEDRD